MMRNFQFLGKL